MKVTALDLTKAMKGKSKNINDVIKDFLLLSPTAQRITINIVDLLSVWSGDRYELDENFKLFPSFFKDSLATSQDVQNYMTEANLAEKNISGALAYYRNQFGTTISRIAKYFLMREVQEFLVCYSKELFNIQLTTMYVR